MIYLFLVFLFVIIQGFFSGMETGMVSQLKPRVKRGVSKGERGAKILLYFIEHPGVMLATTLMGTNICVVCSSSMAKRATVNFGFNSPQAFFITACIMSLILFNAEIIPKDWFRQFPYRRCRPLMGIFRIVYYILYVPSRILSAYTTWVNSLFGVGKGIKQDASTIMKKDFSLLLRESERAGVIESNIAEIIDKTLYFHNIKVSELMIQRKDVVELSADASVREALELSKKFNVSRFPVRRIGAETGKWTGLFSVYDPIFEEDEKDWDKIKVSDLMRPIVEISAEEQISAVFVKAKSGTMPILAVHSPGDPSQHIGIISLFSISEKLFGF
ncbi:MAG TPA: CNNM domain-containing protein [Victivallales bacterium]|nr:CNNM domain-containing protein [Victivallales bacterium]